MGFEMFVIFGAFCCTYLAKLLFFASKSAFVPCIAPEVKVQMSTGTKNMSLVQTLGSFNKCCIWPKVFPYGLRDLQDLEEDPTAMFEAHQARSLQHRMSCCVMSSQRWWKIVKLPRHPKDGRIRGAKLTAFTADPETQSVLLLSDCWTLDTVVFRNLYRFYLFFSKRHLSIDCLFHVQSWSKLCIIVPIANINGHVYPVQHGYIPLHLRLFFGQILQWMHWLSIVC